MALQSQSFTGHHHYANIDQQAEPTSFVAHLDQITALEQILTYKRQSYDLLQIQPGQRILDVGCGTGDDVRAMAERVGATGRVIGLDSSATMIQTAHSGPKPTSMGNMAPPVLSVRSTIHPTGPVAPLRLVATPHYNGFRK